MRDALIARLDKFKTEQSDTRGKDQEIDKVPEGFRRPVEAWISAPSRLAFVIKSDPIGLNVAELTAWETFDLRVVQRARRMYSNSDKLIEKSEAKVILDAQGIEASSKTG